jgi:hypothetical protein
LKVTAMYRPNFFLFSSKSTVSFVNPVVKTTSSNPGVGALNFG